MPSNWLVFDRIRALARQHRLYRAERVYQDQTQLDKLVAGGDFADFGQQSAILDQTNLQINRLERYKDYEQMDQTGEITLALDLYADESSLVDPERKHTLVIRAKNKRLKKELEDLYFNTLQWDTYCRPAIRYLCKYGDMPFEVVLDRNRSGVSSLRFMNVYNFTRIETRYGDLVGFFYMDAMWPKPQFMHPWQVMHLRLTSFENIYHPYGKSVIDGGRKAFKQLRLMEDAALIYRITRAPEKRKFTVPVGLIPPRDVPEYMQMIARTFKRQRFYNPATGTFDERYSPLIQDDDFFLPRRPDGTGPDIDVLPGGDNVDKIADIEYFKKKMIAPTKIPFARVGIGDGAGEASEKSLSQAHAEFAKAVQWIQREVGVGLAKIGIIHLALRGYSEDDLAGFEIHLSGTSAMEELYRIETWQTRVGVMLDLKELGWFPKEWIATHFTDLSPDEIQELKDMEVEASSGGGGGGGGLDIPGAQDQALADPVDDAMGGMGDDPDSESASPVQAESTSNRVTGFDYGAEKILFDKLRKNKNHNVMLEFLERMARRCGKDLFLDENINNPFKWMLHQNEFDGLSKNVPVDVGPDEIYDPNDDDGLLVDWKVPHRMDAIQEVYALLTESVDSDVSTDSDEITDDDLPPITYVSDL